MPVPKICHFAVILSTYITKPGLPGGDSYGMFMQGRCLHYYMGAPETSISMLVHFSGFKKLMLNYFNEILTKYCFCVSLECHLLLLTLHKMVPPCCKIIKETWTRPTNMVGLHSSNRERMTGSILLPKVSLSIDASEMISMVNMVATYLCFNLKSRHCFAYKLNRY